MAARCEGDRHWLHLGRMWISLHCIVSLKCAVYVCTVTASAPLFSSSSSSMQINFEDFQFPLRLTSMHACAAYQHCPPNNYLAGKYTKVHFIELRNAFRLFYFDVIPTVSTATCLLCWMLLPPQSMYPTCVAAGVAAARPNKVVTRKTKRRR